MDVRRLKERNDRLAAHGRTAAFAAICRVAMVGMVCLTAAVCVLMACRSAERIAASGNGKVVRLEVGTWK